MADLLGFTESAPLDAASVDPMAQDMATSAAPVDTVAGGKMIPEINALREWEDKHEQTLQETSRQEAQSKEAKRQEAVSQLNKFHAERQEAISKKNRSNRSEEETMEKSWDVGACAGGNPWERVADLIDTNAQASGDRRDTSR